MMKTTLLILLLANTASAKLGSPTDVEGFDDDKGQRKLLAIKSYGGNPPAEKFPLQECEGDCDSDADCGSNLFCFQKTGKADVPGCSGGNNDSSNTDYCVHNKYKGGNAPTPNPPTPSPPTGKNPYVNAVGQNGKPRWAFPLGHCEGDCDRDSDCQGNMVCFQRGKYKAVPGCRDGDIDDSSVDYCVDPKDLKDDDDDHGGDHGDEFRLKLYWQPGYYWQEETKERKWCMHHHYDGLPGNGKCWYGRDKRSCRDDQVYISKCGSDSDQKFRFVKVNGDEVLIRTVSKGGDKCLERSGKSIYLRTCDSNDSQQRWYAKNGSFDGDKFEISQKSYSDYCITQDHHPKAGEVVELFRCAVARSKNHLTSYWNKY